MKRLLDRFGDWLAEYQQWWLLLGILALAAGLRLWQLTAIPPGLLPGEAQHGLVALALLEAPLSSGIVNPYHYMQAGSIALFGNTVWALRVVPALISLIAVGVTFAAVKEWFRLRVALLASLLVAVAPWALHISRINEDMVLGLLLAPVSLWLLGRIIHTDYARWYVLMGVMLGAVAYTSIPFYIVAALLILLGAFMWWRYRREVQRYRHGILIVALSAILTALPLLLYVVFTQDTSVLAHHAIPPPPMAGVYELGAVILNALVGTVAMFHYRGSPDPVYNLPGEPQVSALVGVLLVLGVIIAARRRREARYTLLLAWFMAALVPSLLAYRVAPDVVTTVVAVPVIATLAATGLSELYSRWRGVFPRNLVAKYLGAGVIALSLLITISYNVDRYFLAWASTPATFEAYHEQLPYVANAAGEAAGPIYLMARKEDRPVLDYLLYHRDPRYLPVGEFPAARELDQAARIYVPHTDSEPTPSEGYRRVQRQHSYSRPQTVMLSVYAPE